MSSTQNIELKEFQEFIS